MFILSEKEKKSPFDLALEYFNKNYLRNKNTTLNKEELYKFFHEEGQKIILSNIPTAFIIYFKNMLIILTSPSSTEFCKVINFEGNKAFNIVKGNFYSSGMIKTEYKLLKECRTVILVQVMLLLMLFFYFFFSIASIVHCRSKSLCIFIIIFYFLFLSSFASGTSRYRHPIMPFFSILAGSGYCLVFNKKEK